VPFARPARTTQHEFATLLPQLHQMLADLMENPATRKDQ